ncbi:MAG: hypothetical protein Q9207_008005 [Kuettlingeria erythrocarpa]
MADKHSSEPSYQIRSKPTRIRIVNPETGEALDTTAAPPQSIPSTVDKSVKKALKKSGSDAKKPAKALAGAKKVHAKLPLSTGKGLVRPVSNGDSISTSPERPLPPNGHTAVSADRRRTVPDFKDPHRALDEPQWKPDIYAHAYVPDAFLAVNKSPAILLSSTPVMGVDFARYTSSFASPLFLPPLPSPPAPSFDGALPVDSIDSLCIDNYGQHLSDCIVLDLEAQVPEIRTYDMFGVQLGVVDRVQEMYSLHVPGVRENTPRVAFGDNVMVRQLVMDPTTKLPLAAPASGSTGYQISAVVVGLDRPNEILHLRINGCTPHLLICNASFMVQTRWIKSLQRAVGSVSAELNAALNHSGNTLSMFQTREDSPPSPEHDFGPIGTPIKSPPIKSRSDNFSAATAAPRSPRVARSDYFGALGTPVRSPQDERQDYFGSIVSPHPGGFGTPRLHRMKEAKLPPQKSFHIKMPEAPVKYTNQAWIRRMTFPEESDAVDAIVAGTYGSVPFIIDGPPGTGKTKTMVELVTQLAFDPNIYGTILVCAPSDSAADTLALRLQGRFEPKVMFRLNDFSRTFAEVPQELLPYCYVQDDIFNLPPLPEFMACKIVISTCRTADVLVQARVTNSDLVALENSMADTLNPQFAAKQRKGRVNHLHWSALLVDEAAQATEPELLIPLSVVSPPTFCDSEPNPMFVMAGDQHQLGPRTYNTETTLSISLFERLSNRPIYASHPLARRSQNKTDPHPQMLRPVFANLIRNYRSHPAILAVPSALFYANTLIPEASDTDALKAWPDWRGRGWPVLFACNGGIDDCEDIHVVGGGWYNIREAKKALSHAKSLLESGQIEEQSEICIMSPFRSHVNVLRKMARKAGLWGLNIGPMDAFQGLESRFVIICTTRTRSRFLDEDAVKGAGIVNEPRKFNVAVTRAKQGLIVLGNPWVLEKDPHWSAFMRFCWRNGLWQAEDDADEQPDERMGEAQEKPVNEWEPGHEVPGHDLVGLEKALVYKEQQMKEYGSKAVRRFMNETGEDEVWRLGRLAEEALDG